MKKGIGLMILLGVVINLAVGSSEAWAQRKAPPGKQTSKVYCWQENGMTKCGNIPASQAREINTRTGIATPISSPTKQAPLQNPHRPEGQPIVENLPPVSLIVQSLVATHPDEKSLVEHFNAKIMELKSQQEILGKEHKKQQKVLVKVLQRMAEKELKEHVINDKDKQSVVDIRQSVVELRQSMMEIDQEIEQRERENARLLIEYRQAKNLVP